MKKLVIQNVILIERAEIDLGEGLNILTGETGSGKSAILAAIRLIAGERAESQIIRKGADIAVVEAQLEDTFIRREIYRSGKNRCFIDDAQVSLTTLREAIQIEMVDQNSSILGKERILLDLFSGIELDEFEKSKAEEKSAYDELQKLLQIPKERELEWATKDLALIEGVEWQNEAKLFEEHSRLIAAQEIAEKIHSVSFTLTEGSEIPHLKRTLSTLENCIRFDPKLEPLAKVMKSAILDLEEVGRDTQSYSERLDADPQRLEAVEKKVGQIVQLKRRFGENLDEQKQKLSSQIESLLNIDARIQELEKTHTFLFEKNQLLAHSITTKRKEMAPLFANLVLHELKSLNLPHAQFVIYVGQAFNDIRFLFSANPGHPPVPMEDCASGGELSRLLLAIKTLLADGKSTLVFDEIDSNVGGQTAAVLGEKLKKLAEKRQVICVTHFVQVAKCAVNHFLVTKVAEKESTHTKIQKLDDREKEIEYKRMLGCI